jgi:hypothetical protein
VEGYDDSVGRRKRYGPLGTARTDDRTREQNSSGVASSMGRSGQQQSAMQRLDDMSSEAMREEASSSISWNCVDEGSHAISRR